MEALKCRGEVIGIQIPELSGDFLDGQITPLDEMGGLFHPHPLQVLHWGATEGGLKNPAEVAGAQSHRTGQ